MFEALKKMLTEGDNTTPCPVRVATAITAFLYHAGATVGLVMHDMHLDMATLGQYIQHMALLIGAGGGTVGLKSALKADAKDAP
jgi:hypothetical protein